MRRMEKITGRSDDLMIVRGVNVFPTQVEELVLSVEGLTPYFQCVLERPHRLDELTIVVEAAPSVRDRRWPELGDALAGLVKHRIGVSAGVRVVEPGGIERSLGKARRIVDNRPRA
jgi:phenylacetate-CoA ligase